MNLPIFNRHSIIVMVWFAAVALLEPKLLFNKTMYWLYICVGLYCIGELTLWDNISNISDSQKCYNIIVEYAWIALPITMNLHYILSNDYKGYRFVTLVALLFIFITSVTSIIGLNIYPEASRTMAVGVEARDYMFHNLYRKMGIATYGFYIIVMILIIPMGYYLKMMKHKYLKILCVFALLISIYSIYKGQHTTILLFAVVGFVISLFNVSKNFKTKLVITICLLVFFYSSLSESLKNIADSLPESSVSVRLRDISQTIKENNYNTKTSDSYFVSERLSRTEYSLDMFLASPIIGSGKASGHSFWLDRLALYGLVGFIPIIMTIISSIKLNICRFSYSYRMYYYLALSMMVLFGSIKNMSLTEIFIGFIFLMPGIYYIYNNPAKIDKGVDL